MHDYSVPEILDRLNANSGAQGFNRWFGLRGLAAGHGQVEIEVPIRADMRQHHGYVHGGCIGALADMAAIDDDEIDNLDRSAINHGPRPKRRAALNSGLVEEPVETAAAAQVDDDDEAEFEF